MKDLDVFIIGGQSNAVGCTWVSTLDEKLRYYYAPRVSLYEEGNFNDYYVRRIIKGITCNMGHDDMQMGIEYGIGYGLTKQFPKREIGLIRYAYGGTTLFFHWKNDYETEPQKIEDYGICYHDFIKTVKTGLSAYASSGEYNPIVRGLVWMQGETDAVEKEWADAYDTNLKNLFENIRKDLGLPELKIIVGEIATYGEKAPYSDIIRKCQREICDIDERNIFVSTKNIKIGHDGFHFDGNECFKLGKKFAKEMGNLIDR